LSTNVTFSPRSSCKRLATGCSEYSATCLPLGRPKCDRITTAAPRSRRSCIVGSAARIRVSSPTEPSSFSGTLKSTRQRARRPRTASSGRSAIVMRSITGSLSAKGLANHIEKVHATVRVAPLVVVPAADLDQPAIDHVGRLRVENARRRMANVVSRYELLFRILQEALQRAIRRIAEGGVHFFRGHVPVHHDGEVRERHVGRGHANG